jgi:hypothetical protein
MPGYKYGVRQKSYVLSTATPVPFLFGYDPRLSERSKVQRPDDEGSRMGDEGCPNESPSVEDATGYSQEEEEVFPEDQADVSSR